MLPMATSGSSLLRYTYIPNVSPSMLLVMLVRGMCVLGSRSVLCDLFAGLCISVCGEGAARHHPATVPLLGLPVRDVCWVWMDRYERVWLDVWTCEPPGPSPINCWMTTVALCSAVSNWRCELFHTNNIAYWQLSFLLASGLVISPVELTLVDVL